MTTDLIPLEFIMYVMGGVLLNFAAIYTNQLYEHIMTTHSYHNKPNISS